MYVLITCWTWLAICYHDRPCTAATNTKIYCMTCNSDSGMGDACTLTIVTPMGSSSESSPNGDGSEPLKGKYNNLANNNCMICIDVFVDSCAFFMSKCLFQF